MKMIDLGRSGLHASAIALGVMRLPNLDRPRATELLDAAYDVGINFFDNADVYSNGKAEQLFGDALKKASFTRDQVLIQTKVGIVNDRTIAMISPKSISWMLSMAVLNALVPIMLTACYCIDLIRSWNQKMLLKPFCNCKMKVKFGSSGFPTSILLRLNCSNRRCRND